MVSLWYIYFSYKTFGEISRNKQNMILCGLLRTI